MKNKRSLVVEFGYTTSQRKGIVIFLVITFVGIFFFKWLFKPRLTESIHLDEFVCLMDTHTVYGNYKTFKQSKKEPWTNELSKNYRKKTFYFDPNTCSRDSLSMLGFSSSAIKSILNYRSKGGVIYNIEKFKRMYGVDSLQLNDLEPWIKFPESKFISSSNKLTLEKRNVLQSNEKILLELNKADSFSLTQIKGIGAFWASKIIKMRSRCGGFISLDEIKKNEWLPDSILTVINPYIYVDPANMPKIDINKADYKILVRQPYFDKKKVQILLKYRESNGFFRELNDLRKIAAFDEEFFKKINPHFFIGQ